MKVAKPIRRPKTVEQVKKLLSQVLVEVHAGMLDAQQGRTIAHTAGLLLRAIRANDLEARIRRLEAFRLKRD